MSQMQPLPPNLPPAPSNPSSPSGVDLNSLISLFWRAFRQELAAAGGYSLNTTCERRVDIIITDGAKELVRIHAQKFQVDQAEENLRSFAREMISEGQRRGVLVLDESIFISVISFICPLWPFC